MYTYEFDSLDRMLNVAGIEHNMRFGKSSVLKSDKLFYILDVANKLEVRLSDVEDSSDPDNNKLFVQELKPPYELLGTKLTAQQAMSKIMFKIYYLGEKNDESRIREHL